jgi:hypothetical protein
MTNFLHTLKCKFDAGDLTISLLRNYEKIPKKYSFQQRATVVTVTPCPTYEK